MPGLVNSDELEFKNVLDDHHRATTNLAEAWEKWVLGHRTDHEFNTWLEEFQVSYTTVCGKCFKRQKQHIEARRNTRARYLAEQSAGLVTKSACDLCGREDMAGQLQNIGSAPDHMVYACPVCLRDLPYTYGRALTPYGERLEALRRAIEKLAEATDRNPEDVVGMVLEGTVAETEDLLKKRREKINLYGGLSTAALQFCNCEHCRAELKRRGAASAKATKSALLSDMLKARQEVKGMKVRSLGPSLFGLFLDPTEPPSTEPSTEQSNGATTEDVPPRYGGLPF